MGSKEVRDIVRRKYTIEILKYLSGGIRNYSDIEGAVNTSSDTVSGSLDLLKNYGLVERNEVSKKDVRYNITARGEEFLEGVRELDRILSEDD